MPNISIWTSETMRRYTRLLILCIVAMLPCIATFAAPPRLVVNIVVGSMSSNDLDRFAPNLTEGGFRRIMQDGVTYTQAYYDFSTLSTASGLATLSTGATPAVHGVVGERWWSHTDAKPVWLVNDSKARPIEFSTGSAGYSAHRLTAPTYGDMLLASNSSSKQFSIALEPLSAIVLNGKHGTPLWAEKNQSYWTTSSAFCDRLPQWIIDYNKQDSNKEHLINRWQPIYKAATYRNSEVAIIEGIRNKHTQLITDVNLNLDDSLYSSLLYTPAGNTATLRFAEQIIRNEGLGLDTDTDILNIYLDAARHIVQIYGPESMEYEDMIYRLDKDIIWFLDSLYAHVGRASDVVIIVTSDHGTSPSFNPANSEPRFRLNHRQMEVIVNAFLGSRYGTDNYVAGYANKSLYLNHATIAKRELVLRDVCDDVANFLIQLQGISNAISAYSMRNTCFSHGRSMLMQQGFFCNHSGDILIDLDPGCIIESNEHRSLPSAGYNYDRHVPLIISEGGSENRRVEEHISMCSLAPTLCHIMQIDSPWATEAAILPQFK